MNYHAANYYSKPASMYHGESLGIVPLSGDELWGKQIEARIKMRVMNGSRENAEYDQRSLDGMIACIGDNDLWWKHMAKMPGNKIERLPEEDHVPLYAQARVVLALLYQYQFDGNRRWLRLAERLAKGMQSVAIQKDDYAYYPDSPRAGGTLCMPKQGSPSTAEPAGLCMCPNDDSWRFSSACVEFSHGGIVRALCKLYTINGDESVLDFAGKLARFMMSPRMWQPLAKPFAVVAGRHGWFDGHIHAFCWGLWGLLDYADLTRNDYIKAFVCDGYQYVRTIGVARIGLFGEGCTVGDMTNLAIRLSETGMGDDWEDVDQYVRNHLTEIQLLNAGQVEEITNAGPSNPSRPFQTQTNVIERNVGALFADATHATIATPGGIYCCTYNGLTAYYRAWKSIVQPSNHAVYVNLLLNRTSPWVDVESYLPYEGKVVLRNKSARRLCIRIPRWVDTRVLRSTINRQKARPYWINRYLLFDNVAPGMRWFSRSRLSRLQKSTRTDLKWKRAFRVTRNRLACIPTSNRCSVSVRFAATPWWISRRAGRPRGIPCISAVT